MKKIYTSPETKMVKVGTTYSLLASSIEGVSVFDDAEADGGNEVLTRENRFSDWSDEW